MSVRSSRRVVSLCETSGWSTTWMRMAHNRNGNGLSVALSPWSATMLEASTEEERDVGDPMAEQPSESTSRSSPTARRASGRSRSSPRPCLDDVDTLAKELRRYPRRRTARWRDVGRRGLLPARPGRRAAGADAALRRHRRRPTGPSPARRSTSSACPTRDDDDDQAPAGRPRDPRRPGDVGRWTWARCSTTTTSTPRRCSQRHRRQRRASAPSSTSWSALPSVSRRRASVWTTAMRAALAEARAAAGDRRRTVGAVVLGPGGERHRPRPQRPRGDGDPTGHAEVVALRAAAASAGRVAARPAAPWSSPWSRARCAPARSVLSRVERVVFGAYDEKAGAVGSLWDVVRDRRLNHRPEVIAGVLADECTALLERLLRRHTADRFRRRTEPLR